MLCEKVQFWHFIFSACVLAHLRRISDVNLSKASCFLSATIPASSFMQLGHFELDPWWHLIFAGAAEAVLPIQLGHFDVEA